MSRKLHIILLFLIFSGISCSFFFGCKTQENFVVESVIGVNRVNLELQTTTEDIPLALRKDLFPTSDEELLKQMALLMNSEDFHKETAVLLQSYEKPEWGRGDKSPKRWTSWLRKHVKCRHEPSKNALVIQASHPERFVAVILADTYQKHLMQYAQRRYQSIQSAAINWLSDQIQKTLEEISKEDAHLPTLSGVASIDAEAKLVGLKHRLEELHKKKALFEVNAHLNGSPFVIVDQARAVYE